MFLWEPSKSSKPLQRMTGHLQLINQVGKQFLARIFACLPRYLVSENKDFDKRR